MSEPEEEKKKKEEVPADEQRELLKSFREKAKQLRLLPNEETDQEQAQTPIVIFCKVV